MLRTWQQCVSLVAGMCMALGVSAQTLTMASPSPYQWVIEAGWNDGGDKMADGNYVNTGKPWEIRAGKGVQGGGGLAVCIQRSMGHPIHHVIHGRQHQWHQW